MHPITGQLAAIMASTDGIPRLVRHAASLFLVTPKGDVWRVYDSSDLQGKARHDPSDERGAVARVFVGGRLQPVARLNVFNDEAPRTIGAERLHEQLLASEPISW
jgi:hypothetical protein